MAGPARFATTKRQTAAGIGHHSSGCVQTSYRPRRRQMAVSPLVMRTPASRRKLPVAVTTAPCGTTSRFSRITPDGSWIRTTTCALPGGRATTYGGGAAVMPRLRPGARLRSRRYRIVQRVGGQYVATTGPMNALRGTVPHVRESHEPSRLSPIMK